jgi:hypothetical protein
MAGPGMIAAFVANALARAAVGETVKDAYKAIKDKIWRRPKSNIDALGAPFSTPSLPHD